jgi:hypothetical protein
MQKFFVVAALLTAFVFTACDQAVQSAMDIDSAALTAVSGVTQPNAWQAFTPLPFGSGYPNVTALAGIASDGNTNLVVAAWDGAIAYASFFNGTSWSTPANLSPNVTIKPGAAHYLNGNYLITGSSTSTIGAYSTNGTTWSPTGNIGFGTKVGFYAIDPSGRAYYVVAGQNGQVAYADNLAGSFTTIPNTTTGWPASGGTAYINAGAYNGSVYVFGGGNGRIATTNSLPNPSDDPWNGATIPAFGTGGFINAIATNGGSTFVAVGNDASNAGVIVYSTNSGTTWTAVNLSGLNIGTTTIYALAYGGGYFAAMNDAGSAAYSANGSTWFNATNAAFNRSTTVVNAMTYASTKDIFYAAGQNNGTVQIGFAP